MKNSKALFNDFVNSITLRESRDEIESIAYVTFEKIFGLNMTQVLADKEITDQSLVERLGDVAKRINDHEPIQYILGEALFYNRSFIVNPSVLIPRPETEELVRFVVNYSKETKANLTILDIGTGSGCIAVTLALELPASKIFATDVSEAALRVAEANARELGAIINFQKHDVLNEALAFSTDVIVSNPPYIGLDERDLTPINISKYEPALALFADSDDPLIFYKALVKRAGESLRPNGLLAVEINERFGREVSLLLAEYRFRKVDVLKDFCGKDRIVKGILSS
jgi:release factor glutamine methyltransferase